MTIILNPGAGAAAAGKASQREQIERHYKAAGAKIRILEANAERNVSVLAREAAQSDDDTVVAAGGDGTISAVAAEVADTGKQLGVLPVGTLNHFAKDLRIPLELEDAVRTTLSGNVTAVDVAEVNGRVFINNSSLGLYPYIVAKREEQQQRLSRGKWSAFARATVHALHRFPFMDLSISVHDQQLARRTAFLFVGNNEYEISGFSLGGRSCMDAGNLGLYLTHSTGRFGLFRLAFRALFGRVEQAEEFDAFCVQEARIDSRRSRLLVARDGEVEWMDTPLHYRTRRAALRVLVSGD
ncbi:MAG: sphingosine kinase [Chthoniobacterales bacterium]|nr:sphingosine kinase [Chthoniobacterales bacterium]